MSYMTKDPQEKGEKVCIFAQAQNLRKACDMAKEAEHGSLPSHKPSKSAPGDSLLVMTPFRVAPFTSIATLTASGVR